MKKKTKVNKTIEWLDSYAVLIKAARQMDAERTIESIEWVLDGDVRSWMPMEDQAVLFSSMGFIMKTKKVTVPIAMEIMELGDKIARNNFGYELYLKFSREDPDVKFIRKNSAFTM